MYRQCWKRTTASAMAGAVLNSINTRLDAAIIAFTLDHGSQGRDRRHDIAKTLV